MQNFTTSHDDIETLWDDPKVTVQERRNSFRNKKQTSSRRRKFLSDDEQGENSRFRSIFEEVKRDFEQLNARQTHMDIAGHTSMPNMVASGISLEASLNDLSTGSSDGKKGSLKDRMMLTATTFEEHLVSSTTTTQVSRRWWNLETAWLLLRNIIQDSSNQRLCV
jgi:hypothetical protein